MLLAYWLTGLIYLALIVLIALLVIAMIVGYELLRRDFKRLAESNAAIERTGQIGEALGELRQQVNSATQSGQKELGRLWRKTDESLSDRLQRGNDLVSQVRQSLGAINEASQRIHQLGSQMAGLSEALRMPPPGSIGAGGVWLADLLGQMLPPQHYQLNASLGDGRPADAAVRLGDYLIAIDAGFPVSAAGPKSADEAGSAEGEPAPGEAGESIDQIARRHIDRVATECIRMDHGTVDFALMYLPSESLYYELIIRHSNRPDSVSSYALARRVIPVSPNTLYAYLYTIVLGLRGLQVEQQAAKIIDRLGQLRDQFSRFQEAFVTVGVHLDRAGAKYDAATRLLTRFSDRLTDTLPKKEPSADLPAGRGQPPTELERPDSIVPGRNAGQPVLNLVPPPEAEAPLIRPAEEAASEHDGPTLVSSADVDAAPLAASSAAELPEAPPPAQPQILPPAAADAVRPAQTGDRRRRRRK